MEIYLIMAAVCAVIGFMIDNGRGFALGLILGVFGLLISAILKTSDAKGE